MKEEELEDSLDEMLDLLREMKNVISDDSELTQDQYDRLHYLYSDHLEDIIEETVEVLDDR